MSAATPAVATPSAFAVPDRALGIGLGAMWKTILETPAPENPYNGGNPCVRFGPVVAPFSATGDDIACTVRLGTPIFVAPWSAECSTLEAGSGRDAAELRRCAVRVNSAITHVSATRDGRPLKLARVTSPLVRLNMPADNILGAAPGTGPTPDGLPYQSVANGWVALLFPLTPGTHTIKIRVIGVFPVGDPAPGIVDVDNITKIKVLPRHKP